MSYIKFSPNLFLGTQELSRFKSFLDDTGWRKGLLEDSIEFGFVDNSIDGNFTNFLIEQGTNVGTIKNSAGLAIDINGDFIIKDAEDNIALTDDNSWYWLMASHTNSPTETGTVSVDANGNLTGTGTLFTDILRGQPNHPSRIQFIGASLNTLEYDVVSVTNDTTVILSGIFQAENNLQYSVIGTFTPDAVPPSLDKEIFQYDSTTFVQVAETVLNTPPTISNPGEEFYVARVRRNGVSINIEDKRRNYLYKSNSNYLISNLDRVSNNPLIGFESVKFDDAFSTKQFNIVEVAWGFRSSNWTVDTSTNKVTLNGGQGGKFKSTTDFSDNDFDGWRIYTEDGQYSIIKASSISGSQINLTLGTLDPDTFSNGTQELVVTPNVNEIEIIATPPVGDANQLVNDSFRFPINIGQAKFKLLVYKDPSVDFIVTYRYKQNAEYTIPRAFPDDLASGYLTEDSFDAAGNLTGTSRQTYTGSTTVGYLTLQLSATAFKNIIAKVDLGDLPGVVYKTLDNGNPILTLSVGADKGFVVVQGNLTFSADHFLNISTDQAVDGNRFYVKFENDATLSTQEWKIVQDYINPGSPGSTLLDLANPTTFWRDRAAENNMLVLFEFDGTNWVMYPDASVTQAVLDLITGGTMLKTGDTASGVLKYDADPTGKAGWDLRSFPDRQYVDDQITALIGGAPATLNTLNELAAAMGDDASFSSNVVLTAGTNAMQGNLDLNTNKIIGLLAGTGVADAIRKDQAVLRDGTQAFTGDQSMGTNKLTALVAGTVGTDAVNKTQLDTKEPLISASNRVNATEVATGVVDNTEFNYLNGVTSAIQTQFSGKEPTISASNRVAAANLETGVVSGAEFNYLNGVTSAIQTQLDDIVTDQASLKYIIIAIGTAYDMSGGTTISRALTGGVTRSQVRSISAAILTDDGLEYYDFAAGLGGSGLTNNLSVRNDNKVYMFAGAANSNLFTSTTGDFNDSGVARGYIVVGYL